MEIRRAKLQDLETIMEIYAHARDFMKEHGNPRQWGMKNWPPKELIRQDIERGTSYVCEEEGQVAAVFYFEQGENIEPCYNTIEGAWIGGSSYGAVHRIASANTVKGAGTFCINWAFAQCGHLRMDTHGDNKVMQNLLKKLGFTYCGIIYVKEEQDPRLAFEKIGTVQGEGKK